MKKILALAISVMLLGAGQLVAQTGSEYAETASKELYKFENYGPERVLAFFKKIQDEKGRKFPTAQEWKDEFGFDVELIRSHVKKREIIGTQADQLNPKLRQGRTVWLNIAAGVGRAIGGFPSGRFNNDIYTMWQYVDLHGAWNHPFFQAPGSWASAAHKHGVDMMSGIVFFDTTGNAGNVGSEGYEGTVLKKENGEFIYAEPLIHALMFLGLDGINYNWEDGSYYKPEVLEFHHKLREYATSLGFKNYRQGIYTSNNDLSYGSGVELANGWLGNKTTNYGDVMLNYGFYTSFTGNAESASEIAKNLTGSYDHLYAGTDMQKNVNATFPTMLNVPTNLCIWAGHDQPEFFKQNNGATSLIKVSNYQKKYENLYSGGSRNVAHQDTWGTLKWADNLKGSGGVASMIPERTTLKQNLPFCTYFNTGAGERYFYKGKTASKGGWYDMAAQDYQPTYRWLQYTKGTTQATIPVQVEYTYEDAYIGGSSLFFKGNGNVDIILYRGELTISSDNPKAEVALKTTTDKKDHGLQLLLHKKGVDKKEYVVVPFDALTSKAWEEQSKSIDGLNKGDVIDFIGVRLSKEADVYLGKIALTDDSEASPAPSVPLELKADVKEETKVSLSAMLSWKVDALPNATLAREDHGLVYNDEAGIHHFEILYKEGAKGKVRELGRTTSWSTYVPRIDFKEGEKSGKTLYFGVRSVANDLKTCSKVTWIEVETEKDFLLPEASLDYCTSILGENLGDPEDAVKARAKRFLTLVKTLGATTKDLNYENEDPIGGDNYVYHKDALEVNQGDELTFTFKGAKLGDGLEWCYARTFIDWNGNGEFEQTNDPNTNERISQLDLGKAKTKEPAIVEQGLVKHFKIPEDALTGKVLRARIVFNNNWHGEPTPCGETVKGFTFDFDVKVSGTNPPREAIDYRDEGEPEAPENVVDGGGITPIELVEGAELPKFYPNPANSLVTFENTDTAWIYNLQGQLVMLVKGRTANIASLPAGTYVVKAERNNVTRSYKLIKK